MEAQFAPRLGKTTMLDTPNSALELEIYENPGANHAAGRRSSKQLRLPAAVWCSAKDEMLGNSRQWQQEHWLCMLHAASDL
jgi:hypothetical protein